MSPESPITSPGHTPPDRSMQVSLAFKTYSEAESFQCNGDPEPYVRRQYLIYDCRSAGWHVKATLNNEALIQSYRNTQESISPFLTKPVEQKSKRGEELNY